MEEELKRLISENKVIPFVGAGVSKDVKNKDGKNIFVNWKELLEILNKKVNDENKRNGIGYFLKSKNIDYLQIADMIEKELSTHDFNKVLKETFDIDLSSIDETTIELAKTIWELNSKLIITTNYDKVLHHSCPDINRNFWDIEASFEQASSLRDGVKNSTIWHIHGHIDNVDNIILTSEKYDELYTINSENSKYKSALEALRHIISSKSLLFIGFSLDDEFIIEQLNRTIKIFGENSHEHYVLSKKGSTPNTLGKSIKVIEYENHGQDLINKIKSLVPTSIKNENKIDEIIPTQIKETYNQLTKLPSINKDFIGRKNELDEIEKRLAENKLTCIVNGIGGVGKSELSYKYLHENKHKYKNIAFIEFTENDSSVEEVFIRKFKDEFGLENDVTLDSVIMRLQKLPERNLLLLDNLENIEDFEKIKALNTNFDLLITTRKDLDKKNQLNLDILSSADAKELFLSIYDKDEDIEDILEYLDNHPLFITLTAKSLENKYISMEELRENIKNNTISKIDSKDDKTFQEHLLNTFNSQFTRESKDELKELLQLLSIFPSIEISFEILEKSIGLEKLRINLQKLIERGWLTNKEDSYKLHQIIRTFILTEYKIEYEKVTFIFESISKYINPDDSTLIVNRLNGYIPIIESFLDIFKEKDDDFICGILDSITYLFYSLAQYKKAFDYQNRALKFRIKNHGENSEFTAKGYNLLSLIYHNMGDLKKALEYQEKALKLREEILGDKHPDLARSYNNISLIYRVMGDLKKALEYQKKSLKIKEEILGDSHPDFAISFNNISMIYQDKGDLKKALEYQEKALNLNEKILEDKHPDLATNYNNISMIYKDMGGKKNLEKALEYQGRDIKLTKEILGDKHPDLAQSYNNISYIYKNLKECLKAKEYMQKAINIWYQYEYYDNKLIIGRKFIKEIEYNIKQEKKLPFNKKGRFCKDT